MLGFYVCVWKVVRICQWFFFICSDRCGWELVINVYTFVYIFKVFYKYLISLCLIYVLEVGKLVFKVYFSSEF